MKYIIYYECSWRDLCVATPQIIGFQSMARRAFSMKQSRIYFLHVYCIFCIFISMVFKGKYIVNIFMNTINT